MEHVLCVKHCSRYFSYISVLCLHVQNRDKWATSQSCVCVCVQPVSLYGSNQFELFEVNLPGFNFTSRNSFYVFSTSSTVQVIAVAATKIPLRCLARIQWLHLERTTPWGLNG